MSLVATKHLLREAHPAWTERSAVNANIAYRDEIIVPAKRNSLGRESGNPTLSAIQFIRTDLASWHGFMGYSGTLVFLGVAWLTVLHGRKVENQGFFCRGFRGLHPWALQADFQRHPSGIWRGGSRFQEWSGGGFPRIA